MGVHLLPFLGIAILIILAPGPDTVIVTKNALLHGRRSALGTSVGVNVGLLIWTTAAACGIAAVVRESAVAFTVLKLAGAVYLTYLGVQALRAARGAVRVAAIGRAGAAGSAHGWGTGFRQGLASNLANPKIAVFFTTLLPGFVSAHHPGVLPFLLLGSLFVLLTLAWLSAYAVMAVRLSELLTRPRVKAALDAVTGVVLIGFGARLALEHR